MTTSARHCRRIGGHDLRPGWLPAYEATPGAVVALLLSVRMLMLLCAWLMQAVEQTIQNLIGSGMDPKTDNDPYNGFIYTSFQVIFLS